MKLLQTRGVYGIYLTALLLAVIGSVRAATGTINRGYSETVPQRVMTCEAPVEFTDRHTMAGQLTPDPRQAIRAINLIRQVEGRYDVRIGEDSVTVMGRLSGLSGDVNPVHLILETGTGTEHFLFMQNPDGSGELLWSSATASALTTCSTAHL